MLTTLDSVNNWLTTNKLIGKTLGFVPTMGALHSGHLSLVHKAKVKCDLVIASVFVNPTQFNSAEDLEKYPRGLTVDKEMLVNANCDALFAPEIKTIYPDFPEGTHHIQMDFGGLDLVMEGAFRPGHFSGVANVVHRLFEIIQPDVAFFGEKDFQQLSIIQRMVEVLDLSVEIVSCSTLREASGLAMSSRNQRLSEQGKIDAEIIYKTLLQAKKLCLQNSPKQVKAICANEFQVSPLKLEYLEIVNPKTLHQLDDSWVEGSRCFIAAYCEDVRLIDNMELIP